MEKLIVKGVKVHNLKNITVEFPKNKLIAITGLSGSGKSSLAFDTIYAEGQRRYVESLSSYARQFLGIMRKPEVEKIEGLSPAISIAERKPSKNPRSTVGTVTEIYDYLRLLFARIGIPYCYKCNRKITSQTIDQIVEQVLSSYEGKIVEIFAPVVVGRKGEYQEVFEKIKRKGYIKVRVDKEIYEVEEVPKLERYKRHNIDIVVDKLRVKEGNQERLIESIELAMKEGGGVLYFGVEGKEEVYNTKLSCPLCGISYEEISPRMFSFNSPYGACEECGGLGSELTIDPELIIEDKNLSVMEGAIEPWGEPRYWLSRELHSLMRRNEEDEEVLYKAYKKLTPRVRELILYGDYKFKGVIPFLIQKYKETDSDYVREEIERYMRWQVCPKCKGGRLKEKSLAVKVGGKNIQEVTEFTIEECYSFFSQLTLNPREKKIAKELIREIKRRLKFLLDVGLYYLTLSRKQDTLSGGEDERVRLATQIGSGLTGVIYILDEPTIGLHCRDVMKLITTLKNLKNMGNTVIVVEHDKNTILQADWVVDLGPGGGEYGGKVVAVGTPQDIMRNSSSLTGKYLSGKKKISIPLKRRRASSHLIIKGAKHNNLKSITVKIPLKVFVVITGVSGSGKSSLINDTLYKILAHHFWKSKERPGEYEEIINIEAIDKVVNIDQSPIGRTPRSNPATYTGAFTPIRELFSKLKVSQVKGYSPGRFSFNVEEGRCSVCKGEGLIKVEMHFLPDVYVECEVCKGKRFNKETLEITYKGKNIAEVLEMTVSQAKRHFKNIPKVERKLSLLEEVGLGYIKLGQPAPTLSGGEAQRIKLAKELSKIPTGNTLYLLDEPTVGLHFEDVKLLLQVLNKLVDKGNTVLVIEHNLEVIKCADWVIDLGPEGGERGGEIVVEGTPEEVSRCGMSYTGKYLREELK